MATCKAVHFAVCHALYNNKNKKIGKNRCLVFLNDLVLSCSVILSLQLLCLINQDRTKGRGLVDHKLETSEGYPCLYVVSYVLESK